MKPVPATDLSVDAYATGLDHPRWLHVLPNGDVLVAETNAPPGSEGVHGFKGMVFRKVQSWAGAGVPSANRITLLRDADGDGVAETRTVFLEGLNSPFGMTLVGNDLYVANTDAVLRFPDTEGDTQIDKPGVKVAELPAGPLNHHWTKGLIASHDGSRLYVSSARTAMSARTDSTRRIAVRRSSRSTAPKANRECLPPACAIPSACPGSHEPASYGRW